MKIDFEHLHCKQSQPIHPLLHSPIRLTAMAIAIWSCIVLLCLFLCLSLGLRLSGVTLLQLVQYSGKSHDVRFVK